METLCVVVVNTLVLAGVLVGCLVIAVRVK